VVEPAERVELYENPVHLHGGAALRRADAKSQTLTKGECPYTSGPRTSDESVARQGEKRRGLPGGSGPRCSPSPPTAANTSALSGRREGKSEEQ